MIPIPCNTVSRFLCCVSKKERNAHEHNGKFSNESRARAQMRNRQSVLIILIRWYVRSVTSK